MTGSEERAPARRAAGRPVEFEPGPVLDAAQRLLEEGGAEALVMRRLAAESGAALAAIYRHLGDRDAVLSAVLDRYAEGIPRPALPEQPEERIVAVLLGMHDVLAERPWIVDVLRRGGQTGLGGLWFADELLRACFDAGLDEQGAVAAYRTAWAYVLGALLLPRGDGRALPDDAPLAGKLRLAEQEHGMTRLAVLRRAPSGFPREVLERGARALVAGMLRG